MNKYGVTHDQKPPCFIDMKKRNELARLFKELNYKEGVELGVERGLFTQILCMHNPQAHIIGIDPWQKYKGYRDHVSQDKLDGFFDETMKRMSIYENASFIRKFSMDAVNDFADGQLDFVYIDANHEFLHIAQDLVMWSKKVRPGGIVSGHDFTRRKGRYVCHVKDVVQAYMYSHRIRPWFVMTASRSPSWFYVKGE
jgi:hypothetical protein